MVRIPVYENFHYFQLVPGATASATTATGCFAKKLW